MKSILNNDVSILHFPGTKKDIYQDLIFEYAKNIKIELPNNVSIISPMTDDYIKRSPLHLQCYNSGIEYFNSDIINNKPWQKQGKPIYIADALNKISTNYCLILDGIDTVFCNSANNIIEELNSYKRKVIYNAGLVNYPNKDILEYFGTENKLNPKLFYHINGGACIGETEQLKIFYNDLASRVEHTPYKCEQVPLRILWKKYQEDIFIDYKFKIFQIFGRLIIPKNDKAILLNYRITNNKVGD